MTEEQFETIHIALDQVKWTEQSASEHGIKFGIWDERRIQFALVNAAHHALVKAPNEPNELRSRARVAESLDNLLYELKRQRAFKVGRPEREGLEQFVLYSQKDHIRSELRDWNFALLPKQERVHNDSRDEQPASRLYKRWTPGRPQWPRDNIQHGKHYTTIGETIGWLETLLAEISDNVFPSSFRSKTIGRPSKRNARDALWYELADFYEIRGGAIKVNKNVGNRPVGGRFIVFLESILGQCPNEVKDYFGRGMGDAVLDWLKRGRPASNRIHRLPLI